jgi:hypothetical protein
MNESSTPPPPTGATESAANNGNTPAALTANTGTSTWQIWTIVLLPLIALPALFFIDASALVPAPGDDSISAQLRIYTDPGYLFTLVTGWLIFIANIFLAIFDRRSLQARGVARPFHWAFIFIGALVYVIGRSVIVRSRTGQGLAPLWAVIAVQLAGIVAGIALMVKIVNTAFAIY